MVCKHFIAILIFLEKHSVGELAKKIEAAAQGGGFL
jgi:hypothetical protein